jgi:hypothetical protein
VDRKDSLAGKPVFNRTVTLRDAWQKWVFSLNLLHEKYRFKASLSPP